MRMLRLVAIASTIVVSLNAQAQNLITELSGSTYREKTVYAVYDLPGTDIKVETIENAVLDAIHLYARDARVQQGIPPSPFPDYPGQMTLGRRMSGGPKPDCAGEVFSIEGIDSSMAKYGEATYHRACLYPYAGGYRINYFAIYGQKSGMGSSNPNALAAMFGRAMAGAVGLNDSSSFINKVLSRLEGKPGRFPGPCGRIWLQCLIPLVSIAGWESIVAMRCSEKLRIWCRQRQCYPIRYSSTAKTITAHLT